MKVYIGPHCNFIGPYQIADLLQYVGVSKDRCFEIGEWLSETWVNDICQWIDKKRKRKIQVRIAKYDSWNLDATLAPIIHPLLIQLKEKSKSFGLIDDEDVPEALRSTTLPAKENEWQLDDLAKDRWTYVLDAMIWSFSQRLPDVDGLGQFYVDGKLDHEGYVEYEKKVSEGFRLFGKYFQTLWD